MNCKMEETRRVTKDLFYRYNYLLLEKESLSEEDEKMIRLIKKGVDEVDRYPLDKLSRWLGYVQCYIIMEGLSSVESERNYSRDMFHAAYKVDGVDIPESFDSGEGSDKIYDVLTVTDSS